MLYRHATIIAIILVAACVFAVELSRGTDFAETAGAIPVTIADATRQLVDGNLSYAAARQLSRLFTAIFLHGGPEHLVYNMVFLWTFGFLTSQLLGQWWALAIFVLCGIAGNILQVCLNLNSPAPIIGASGGISGLAGTYLGLALRWQLPWPDVWPLAHPIPPMQLGLFAVLGFIGDVYLLANHAQHQVAYGAHIGGFLCGFTIATLITTVYPTTARFERRWDTSRR
jgi:membrane associated rhomboid family serine protease